jgi:molecular chaperone DnaJ
VVARVMIPTDLTDQQRKLFQELEKSLASHTIGEDQDEGFFGRIKNALGL